MRYMPTNQARPLVIALAMLVVVLGAAAWQSSALSDQRANALVESRISELLTFVDLSDQGGAEGVVHDHLARTVPGPAETLAAVSNGEVVQMDGAGRELSPDSELYRVIADSPETSGVHGFIHWATVSVVDEHQQITFAAAVDTAEERALDATRWRRLTITALFATVLALSLLRGNQPHEPAGAVEKPATAQR